MKWGKRACEQYNIPRRWSEPCAARWPAANRYAVVGTVIGRLKSSRSIDTDWRHYPEAKSEHSRLLLPAKACEHRANLLLSNEKVTSKRAFPAAIQRWPSIQYHRRSGLSKLLSPQAPCINGIMNTTRAINKWSRLAPSTDVWYIFCLGNSDITSAWLAQARSDYLLFISMIA